MREIKFRVWDGSKMIYPSIIGVPPLENFAWEHSRDFLHNCQEWSSEEGFIIDPNLMQYTGLKDKNGKEIYEGDIVKDSFTVFKIVWYKGRFDFERISGAYQYPYFGDNCQRMEVVGNIYQHPELLNTSASAPLPFCSESNLVNTPI